MNTMNVRIKKYLPAIIFILSAVLLFVKCFLSFCWSDETFYYSTAYRFYMGDSIFRHDWFPTQLSSVILIPFFSLYVKIRGTTDGILLYFRILFVIFTLINSVLAFGILKRHTHRFVALTESVCILFYTHLNIATLSYYTISVQCFLMAMLLLYDHVKRREKRSELIICGIYYAISVLALPTMALGYFITVLILLCLILLKGRSDISIINENTDKALLLDILKYTFAGILIPAVIFFVFLLGNVSISDFLSNIPYVLSDDEHGTSFIYPIKKFFIGINEVFGHSAYISYLLSILCLLFGRKLKEGKYPVIILITDLVLFIYDLTRAIPHTGYIFTVICLFSLPLFFITKKPDIAAFFTFFVNGMVFSLVYSYSSNGYLYILSMGHFIASAGGFIFIYDFIKELMFTECEISTKPFMRYRQSVLFMICFIILSITSISTIVLRIVNIYRDAPVSELKYRITTGPAEGLYTTAEHKEDYDTVVNVIRKYCTRDSAGRKTNSLLISKLLPFGYMCSDMYVGAPTTWRNMISSERLITYYELNPERIPDVILILDEKYGSYETCGDVEEDPCPNENELEGPLMEDILENYERRDVDCGIIYSLK
ncbi:MAG: hypothetical protein K6B28_11055 [Lachnospiraceae bacterium]|nr:hypothetical protein [Lachnospiraceae bacterium]